MPYFLRAIDNNIKWDKSQFPAWLQEGDLPSCIVRDLKADDNELSLWEIPDEETNLNQVITALASTRKTSKNNFDYALLNTKYIDQVTFTCSSLKKGKTPYTDVNSYHRNLSHLSLQKLIYFAYLLFKYGNFRRMGPKELQLSLSDAFRNNKMNLSKVPKELMQELGIPFTSPSPSPSSKSHS